MNKLITDYRDFRVMDSAKGWKVVMYYAKPYYSSTSFVVMSDHTSWKEARDCACRLREIFGEVLD